MKGKNVMSVETIQVISASARIIMIAGLNMGVATFVTNAMLPRRRSLWGISLYWAVKILVQSVLLSYVLPYYYGQAEWIEDWMAGISSIFAVLTFVMYYYTFTGGLLKIAIAAMFGNIVTAFLGYFSQGLVNLMEGRENIWGLTHGFMPMDLAIPAVDMGLLFLLYHYTAPFLHKFRDYELPHRTFFWISFVSFVILGTLTTVSNRYDVAGVATLLMVCVTIFIISWMILNYYKSLQNRQKFLTARQKMSEAHYEVLQGQIAEMEAKQQEIDSQMREISKMQNSEADAKRIARYLSVLRENYETIRAGVYCDNWTIDAVLCTQAQILKKQGINFDCKLQGCDLDGVEEEDFVRILLILLEMGANANQSAERQQEKMIQLRIASVRNQLLIEFISRCGVKARLSKKLLKECLKRYQGTMKIRQKEHVVICTMILPRGEAE